MVYNFIFICDILIIYDYLFYYNYSENTENNVKQYLSNLV